MKVSLPKERIVSIDLLRGFIMIIMALDHVRDYFHADAFLYDPLDLNQTTVILFFTRWITHFCAPVFVFLAGTSAFLSSYKRTKKEQSLFLLTRGLWLVFLELTIINFAWFFNLHFNVILLIVIWAIGMSMIVLSVLIRLPFKLIAAFGLLLVFGHNLLDSVHFDQSIIWAMIHKQQFFAITDNLTLFAGYPLVPWIGVMALGYCFGQFYSEGFSKERRTRILNYMGISAILLFILLRSTNFYGDAHLWITQPSAVFSFLAFLDTTKYPPSLLYLLMTLGPALLFLANSESLKAKWTNVILVYGRVPLFYYVLHIYFLHIGALIAAQLSGYGWQSMILHNWITRVPALKGYGFSLSLVYIVWIALVLLLYPICKWYGTYKSTHRDKQWLSYL